MSKSKEKSLFLETQKDFIIELQEKKKNLLFKLVNMEKDQEILIDNVIIINDFDSVFQSLYLAFNSKTLINYENQKKLFFKSKPKRLKEFLERTPQLTIENFDDSIMKNNFKISLLKDYTTFLEYFINLHGAIICGYTPLYRVSVAFYDYNQKFLMQFGNIVLFKNDTKNWSFDKVYIGDVDVKYENYITKDFNDIRMKVKEVINVKGNLLPLKNIKTKSKYIEGYTRTKNINNSYSFTYFNIDFED